MGMFDYLIVEIQLPDGGPSQLHNTDEPYQTKSLECLMYEYVISARGQLYKKHWEYEWVDSPTHLLGGYEQKIPDTYRREYLTDFHGDVIFYTSKPMSENRVWRDYTARFTEGKLTRIWYEDKQY
jgi:hypothetical protein